MKEKKRGMRHSMTSALLASLSAGVPCPLPPVDERQLMSAYEQGVRFENDDEATRWAEAYAREDRLDELRFLLEHGCRAPHTCAWKEATPRCLKYLIQYYVGLHERGDGRPIDGWVTSRERLASKYAVRHRRDVWVLNRRDEAARETRRGAPVPSLPELLSPRALPEIPFFDVVSGWIEDCVRDGDCERLQVLYECKLLFHEKCHREFVRYATDVMHRDLHRGPRERVLAWYAGLPHREPHLHQEWYENLKRACTTKGFIDTMKFIAENEILPERLLRRLRPADDAESDMDNDIRAYLTKRYASRKELARTILELVDKSKDELPSGDYMQIADTCKLLYNE